MKLSTTTARKLARYIIGPVILGSLVVVGSGCDSSSAPPKETAPASPPTVTVAAEPTDAPTDPASLVSDPSITRDLKFKFTDSDGYTFEGASSVAVGALNVDISNSPPGESQLTYQYAGRTVIRNTTPGRNATLEYVGAGRVLFPRIGESSCDMDVNRALAGSCDSLMFVAGTTEGGGTSRLGGYPGPGPFTVGSDEEFVTESGLWDRVGSSSDENAVADGFRKLTDDDIEGFLISLSTPAGHIELIFDADGDLLRTS